MNVLIACEESQRVAIEFRCIGHNAFSCDTKDCSGGKPEWHLKGSVFDFLDYLKWDLMIAFPPCTHLALSGAAWFEKKRTDGRQREAIEFFMKLWNVDIPKICLENPANIIGGEYIKKWFPDLCEKYGLPLKKSQSIQPYYFGDEAQKKTWLWLKGLSPLFHAKEVDLFNDKITHVSKGEMVEFESGCKMPKWYADAWSLSPKERSELRSKTFPGIARAMAEQWGNI